jgi:hypothetical protein
MIVRQKGSDPVWRKAAQAPLFAFEHCAAEGWRFVG